MCSRIVARDSNWVFFIRTVQFLFGFYKNWQFFIKVSHESTILVKKNKTLLKLCLEAIFVFLEWCLEACFCLKKVLISNSICLIFALLLLHAWCNLWWRSCGTMKRRQFWIYFGKSEAKPNILSSYPSPAKGKISFTSNFTISFNNKTLKKIIK